MPHRLLPKRMTSPTARVIAMIWITVFLVSGYTIYENAREISCERQFRAAIIERAAVSENQRQAIAAWISDFSHPPPGADHYGDDRLDWLQGVSDRALARFHSSETSPLPEISCGR